MKFDEMPAARHKELASKGGLTSRLRRPRPEYCNHRHKLEGDNVMEMSAVSWNKDHTKRYTYTTYRCRACDRERNRKAAVRKRSLRREKNLAKAAVEAVSTEPQYCKLGHLLTGDNVRTYTYSYVSANGRVARKSNIRCMQCASDKYRLKRYGRTDMPDQRKFNTFKKMADHD